MAIKALMLATVSSSSSSTRIYILMIKVNKLIFFFELQYFLKEIDNMFSVFTTILQNAK